MKQRLVHASVAYEIETLGGWQLVARAGDSGSIGRFRREDGGQLVAVARDVADAAQAALLLEIAREFGRTRSTKTMAAQRPSTAVKREG